MRSGGGKIPVSRYVANVLSSSDDGSTHSDIHLFTPLTISSCPLYPRTRANVIWVPPTVASFASMRIFWISSGRSERSPIVSNRIDAWVKVGRTWGILWRMRPNIEVSSNSERSMIFSFESAHMLTYLIPAARHICTTGSTLSPPCLCQRETILPSFFAQRRFPSMINPICCIRVFLWTIVSAE